MVIDIVNVGNSMGVDVSQILTNSLHLLPNLKEIALAGNQLDERFKRSLKSRYPNIKFEL